MAEEQTQPVEQTQEPVQQQPQENVSHETQEATTTEPSPRPEYIPEKFWNTDKERS